MMNSHRRRRTPECSLETNLIVCLRVQSSQVQTTGRQRACARMAPGFGSRSWRLQTRVRPEELSAAATADFHGGLLCTVLHDIRIAVQTDSAAGPADPINSFPCGLAVRKHSGWLVDGQPHMGCLNEPGNSVFSFHF